MLYVVCYVLYVICYVLCSAMSVVSQQFPAYASSSSQSISDISSILALFLVAYVAGCWKVLVKETERHSR